MTEMNMCRTVSLFEYVAEEMISQEKYFCQLDSGLGDGDHGVTISRGFRAAQQILQQPQETLEKLFQNVGSAMMSSMGGAIGPIYALLFQGFAQAVAGKEKIDLSAAADMFEKGAFKVSVGADVQEGQKTMFDALAPAVRVLKQSAKEGKSLSEGFLAARKAAEKGAEDTVDMMAKKGRARFLREKSIGHKDAGAASMAALFVSVSDFLVREEERSENRNEEN